MRVDLLITATVTALISLIAVGTVAYHYLEHWTWVSSFYFTVSTLTTIGYGDLVPTTDTSRLFTAFFALAGVTIAFTSLSALGTIYLRRSESVLSRVGDLKPRQGD